MSFDIQATLNSMLNAVKGVVTGQWPKVRDCAKRALDEEKQFLERLAEARVDGEISDDILAAQLHDERETLATVLKVCELLTMRMAQDAANAAIDAFDGAVKVAVGGARRGATRKVKPKAVRISGRRLNARPDTVDFRDLMYVPTLPTG